MDFSFSQLYTLNSCIQCREGIKSSWFVNHKSICWSHEPKSCKTFIFHESSLLKCDIFKIISVGDTSLYLPRVKWVKFIGKRKKFVNCFDLFNIYVCFVPIWHNVAIYRYSLVTSLHVNMKNEKLIYDHIVIVLALRTQKRTLLSNFLMKQYFLLFSNPAMLQCN